MNTPYRKQGDVPMYPADETVEQRSARLNREIEIAKKTKKKRDAVGALGIATFPCASLLAVGAEWSSMSAAFATMSILAIVIASVGLLAATSITLEW